MTSEQYEQAACRGTRSVDFYPERGENIGAARKVCQTCPVRIPCLVEALERPEPYGVWGGLSERQRRQLRGGRG